MVFTGMPSWRAFRQGSLKNFSEQKGRVSRRKEKERTLGPLFSHPLLLSAPPLSFDDGCFSLSLSPNRGVWRTLAGALLSKKRVAFSSFLSLTLSSFLSLTLTPPPPPPSRFPCSGGFFSSRGRVCDGGRVCERTGGTSRIPWCRSASFSSSGENLKSFHSSPFKKVSKVGKKEVGSFSSSSGQFFLFLKGKKPSETTVK